MEANKTEWITCLCEIPPIIIVTVLKIQILCVLEVTHIQGNDITCLDIFNTMTMSDIIPSFTA